MVAASTLSSRSPHSIVRALSHARTALLRQVHAAADASDASFADAFAHLVAAIEAGFRHEEVLMESVGLPGLCEQRRDNALLLGALHHAASRVEAGACDIGREVLAALPGLLSLHRFCGLRVLETVRGAPLAPRRVHSPSRLAGRVRPTRPGKPRHHA